MKKIIALVVLAAFVAAPVAAAPKHRAGAAKHKKTQAAAPKKKEMTFDEAMAYNKKNLSLIVQGLPLILPTWSLPIVFGLQKHEEKAKHDAKKR